LGTVNVSIETTYVNSEGTAFVLGLFIFNLQTTTGPVVTPWKFRSFEEFPCTLVIKTNGYAVCIHKVIWTKDKKDILSVPIHFSDGAAYAGRTLELPTMTPPEEPNDFRIEWKAVKGGTMDDLMNGLIFDEEPFYVPPEKFEWYKPYPTNPRGS
jgi:hypothetical protein